MVGRMADAEHPLVAAHRAHAAPHLVGQRLKAQALIGRASALEIASLGPCAACAAQKDLDGLLEAALQQARVAPETGSARALSTPSLSGRWKR